MMMKKVIRVKPYKEKLTGHKDSIITLYSP